MLTFEPPAFLPIPKLNKEVELQIHEGAKRRDKLLIEQQKLTQMTIAYLGGVVTALMDPEVQMVQKDRVGMISATGDAAQLSTQLFYEQSQTRKAYILPLIKSNPIRELMCAQITDEFLFGSDLPQKIADLDKVRKVVKQMGPETENKPRTGRDFLERRAAHPNRANKPWHGHGALSTRWNYQGKVPQLGQSSGTNNNKQYHKNNQSKKK